MKIRRAELKEAKSLTKLAVKSESYWDYGEKYIEEFKIKYELTENYINNNPTYVSENNNDIIGFYSIIINHKTALLKYLYIDPKYIGHGYGRILWNHMIGKCKEKDMKKVEFVTSPEAKDFYTKIGAKVIEYINSDIIKNRKIPKMIFKIED